MGKLTAKLIENLREPGKYEDGDGLRLVVGQGASRKWVLRYRFGTQRREMGLGSYPAISLKAARDAAAAVRAQLVQRIDPLAARQAQEAADRADEARIWTFEECAKEYIVAHSPGWKNEKHRQQWPNTLATYAYPVIGSKPVQDVTTADVLAIVRPIWMSKAETASSALTQTDGSGDRLTAARMSVAGLVQMKGLGLRLCSAM